MRPLILALLASVSLPALAQAEAIPAADPAVPAIDVPGRVASADLPSDVPAHSQRIDYGSTPSDAGARSQQAQNQGNHIDPNSVPRSMPPAVRLLSPDRKLPRKARVAVDLATRWRSHFVKPVMGDDGRLHFVWGSGEPVVVCAPLHWCDIALEPGEVITEQPNLGDPRWLAHVTLSHVAGAKVSHVVVKPSDVGLEGNINIQTNRRSYAIELMSREVEYMPLVAFDYPQAAGEETADWQHYTQEASTGGGLASAGGAASGDPCDLSPAIPPSAYRIGDGRFSWRPLQVYAVATPVGLKTCVEFPSDIGSHNLPSLVALANDGGWFSGPTMQMENIHITGRRFMVDGELDRFALIEGVGDSQDKIRVERRVAQ